jgi:hypothetical protein
MFEFITSGSDTILNYHLSQKLKLIEIDEFNHLINILPRTYNKKYQEDHVIITFTM